MKLWLHFATHPEIPALGGWPRCAGLEFHNITLYSPMTEHSIVHTIMKPI
jgi:hypothetical protein